MIYFARIARSADIQLPIARIRWTFSRRGNLGFVNARRSLSMIFVYIILPGTFVSKYTLLFFVFLSW